MHTKLLLVVILSGAGCGKGGAGGATTGADPVAGSAPAPSGTAADPVVEARSIFANRCVPCHGSTGQGDGPASASLNPKPRKYADAQWQASVTDEYIEKIIKLGGAAVGKSPAMPNNPDLGDPAVVAALRDIIRSFGKH